MSRVLRFFNIVPLALACVCCVQTFDVPAGASETKTDIEKLFENVDYCGQPSALAQIDDCLKKHPKNIDLLGMRARWILNNRRAADAEPIFRQILAITPDNVRALAGLSFCQIESKNYKGAYESGRKALSIRQLDPIYPMADHSLIENQKKLALLLGLRAEANRYDRMMIQGDSGWQARTFREQGVLDKGLAVLDKLLKEDPNFNAARLLRGVFYNNKSEHRKAISDFDAVIALQPTMTTAYYLRGDSYFELGEKAKAIESWRQALNAKPVVFRGLVAHNYTAMTGRFREHFEPNDEQVINYADLYYLCGVANIDLGNYEEAEKDFSQCISLDKAEYKAFFNRALVHEKLKQNDRVLADLNQAIKLNAKYIEGYLERARVYERSHQNALAMADYSKVISFNPGDLGALMQRAELAVRIKSYDQALADYGKAIKLTPSEDDPLMGRAKVFTLLGRYDDALADYRQAIKLNPQDRAVVLDHIGQLEKIKLKKNAPPPQHK